MVGYYLDTSAMLKRYVDEPGSSWLRTQMSSASLLVSSQLLIVEVTSAFNRRVRGGTLTPADYQRSRAIFRDDCRTEYQIIAVLDAVVDLACDLLERYSLRSYDALHLATVLTAQQSLRARGLPGLTFLCADDRLLSVATAEGLVVDNPNRHP
jgi:predicted nucleic acid-binding protein